MLGIEDNGVEGFLELPLLIHQSQLGLGYYSGSDSAMITLAGLDYGQIILKRHNVRFCRPCSLDGRGCLALVLAYNRTRGSTFALSLLFGTMGSVTSLFLKFGHRLLLKVLKAEPRAKVQRPSLEEIDEFKSIIMGRYPSLVDVWCVLDGG